MIAGTVFTAAALFVMSVLLTSIGWLNSGFGFVTVMALPILTPIPIVIGILLGFTGQVLCLRTPPELPIARARIRLAFTLEVCGLLTAVLNIPLTFMFGWATGVFPNNLVTAAVFAVSFVLFIAGRVFFLTYTTAIAKAVGLQFVSRPSAAAILMLVAGPTIFATAYSVVETCGKEPITPFEVQKAGVAFVVALCVLGALYVYGRHLRPLRVAVMQFNTRPAKDAA